MLAYAAAPDRIRASLDLPCLFTALFDLRCPGCGIKTAIVRLCEGRWADALQLNPFAPAVLGCIVLVFIGAVRDAALRNGGSKCPN